MHSWKPNHDEVPKIIMDNCILKEKIVEAASRFGLVGDIEIDLGFAFCYQVTVFFPNYFQKQVIKSQFSVYDAFANQFDPNETTKRNLSSQAFIDSNIFRDVTTAKNSIPSDEAMQLEFKNTDVKVLRFKSSKYWLDYVILTPHEPQWH